MKYLTFFLVLISLNTYAAYIVKQTVEDGRVSIESVTNANLSITSKTKLKSIRESISEKTKTREIIFEEIAYPESELPALLERFLNVKESPVVFPGSEVRKIVGTGEDSNRITITILGDGYTLSEKQNNGVFIS